MTESVAITNHSFGNLALRIGEAALSHCPGGRRESEPKNVLVVRLGNIGDIVVALPAFHAIRARFPNANRVLLTSPTERGAVGAVEVLKNDDTFHDTIVYHQDESQSRDFLRRIRREIRRREVDLAIFLPNHLTEFSSCAKYLALFASSGVRRFVGMRLVTRRDYQRAQVDRLLQLLSGLGGVEVEPFPWLTFTPEDDAHANRLLGTIRRGGLIGIHCGSKRPANRWPEGHFVDVARRLIQVLDVSVVLSGSPGEGELVGEVATGIGAGCINACGKTDIGQLTALARRCDLFISNDTGAMHVAYAVGTPVLAIFGGRFHPNIWYPYGEKSRVLSKEIECSPCGHDTCPLYEVPECLTQITPEKVVETALQMWSAGVKGPESLRSRVLE